MTREKRTVKCLYSKCDSKTVYVEQYFWIDDWYGHNQGEIYECTKCHGRWKSK